MRVICQSKIHSQSQPKAIPAQLGELHATDNIPKFHLVALQEVAIKVKVSNQ